MTTSTSLERRWAADPRWTGITRPYRAERRAAAARQPGRSSIPLAAHGARRLWQLLHEKPYVAALSAVTGQPGDSGSGGRARGGVRERLAGRGRRELPRRPCTPTKASTRPTVCRRCLRRIQNALRRADEITHMKGTTRSSGTCPWWRNAEAGFGGVLNAFELMKMMIAEGAAAVHFETSSPQPRSAATWGARCSSPRASSCRSWWRHGSPRTCAAWDSILIARTDANKRDAADERRGRIRPPVVYR